MSFSRYTFSKKITLSDGKVIIPSSRNINLIRKAVEKGVIASKTLVISENERLDKIAAISYGHSNYWWIIAAASGIGWSLQVPPGVVICIPSNLEQIYGYIS
jgi:hypothetical protein